MTFSQAIMAAVEAFTRDQLVWPGISLALTVGLACLLPWRRVRPLAVVVPVPASEQEEGDPTEGDAPVDGGDAPLAGGGPIATGGDAPVTGGDAPAT